MIFSMCSQLLSIIRGAALGILGGTLASCAGAAPTSLPEITALLSHGLADGERRLIYGMGDGQTKQVSSDPAIWIWTLPHKPSPTSGAAAPVLSYTFEEVATCQVRATARMNDVELVMFYDFQGLKSIDVQPQKRGEEAKIANGFGLNAFWVKFDPALTGEYERMASLFFTSLEMADLQHAADQLLAFCGQTQR